MKRQSPVPGSQNQPAKMYAASPLNILYFSSFGNLRWGGQKSLHLLVANLDRNRYRPYVVLPDADDFSQHLQQEGINTFIVELPKVALRNAIRGLIAVNKLRKIILDRNIHILHTDGPRNTLYAGLSAKLTGCPLVWHIRASDSDPYDRLLFGLSERIILVADALRDRFLWQKKNDKFATIYNGVDTSLWEDTDKSNACLRSMFHAGKDTVLIVQLGRIDPLKGQKVLIEAGAILRTYFDFRILLVGEIYSQDYYQECQAMIKESDLTKHVILTGHQEQSEQFTAVADICVSPSHFEAFPRSVIEGMAAGKPVVATDVGGTREAVSDGHTGFIVPPGNPKSLADKLAILIKDSELRSVMGHRSRRRCEDRFSLQRNVEAIEALYDGIVAKRHQ